MDENKYGPSRRLVQYVFLLLVNKLGSFVILLLLKICTAGIINSTNFIVLLIILVTNYDL